MVRSHTLAKGGVKRLKLDHFEPVYLDRARILLTPVMFIRKRTSSALAQ